MHVLAVNNAYPPIAAGGAELIVAHLCEELARRQHRVTVVSTCGPDMEPYPVEQRHGVEIIRFFPPNFYWSFERDRSPGLRKWAWHARDAWNLEAARRFESVLASAQPDIVHTHLIDGFSAAIWACARRLGLPVIHTAHDYHLLCPRAFLMTPDWRFCANPRLHCRLYRQWHLRTARHVDLFVSPSRFLLDMHRGMGLPSPRAAVIHNGIPLPSDLALIRERRPADARTRFLMLTRLTVEKGVRVALDAVARLPRDLRVEVAIAGVGPLEGDVRAAAARDSRIVFLGYVAGAAKTDALARAGFLLLPSLWHENAPVTIIEAAAYGLGVVASDIGGIPEFVEDDATGALVQPGDPAALAAAMTRAATDRNFLPNLASRSLTLARHFSTGRMADEYEDRYARLIAREAELAVAE